MAVTIGDLSVDYDHTADVLYLSIGKPQPSLTFEERDGPLCQEGPRVRPPGRGDRHPVRAPFSKTRRRLVGGRASLAEEPDRLSSGSSFVHHALIPLNLRTTPTESSASRARLLTMRACVLTFEKAPGQMVSSSGRAIFVNVDFGLHQILSALI